MPSNRKKPSGRISNSSRAFFLLLVGIAVTPLDHNIGGHIVLVSLFIITHQISNK